MDTETGDNILTAQIQTQLRPTNLLYWLLFPRLSEAEPLFPWFRLDTLRGHIGKHRLGLPGGVGGALTAASLHAVVPLHGGAQGVLYMFMVGWRIGRSEVR